ncbi:hypothetical protein Tco_0482963, partial [Tanacetum coccineum]
MRNVEIIELESSFELEFYITSRAQARNIKLGRARTEFRARVLVFESSSSLTVLGSFTLLAVVLWLTNAEKEVVDLSKNTRIPTPPVNTIQPSAHVENGDTQENVD